MYYKLEVSEMQTSMRILERGQPFLHFSFNVEIKFNLKVSHAICIQLL